MKKLLLLLTVILIVIPGQSQKIDVYSRPLRSEPSHNYDALHYRINLILDEENKSFIGATTITITALQDNFRACILDAETYSVTEVKNEANNPLDFKQEDHKLIVNFLQTFDYGDTISFTVHYISENVKADPEKFGMGRNYAIGLTFLDETSAHPSLIQALSFPTGARHWYPCFDHPSDKATQEVIATVSSNYKVLSNGKLVNTTEDKMEQIITYHWSQEHPHPTYLSMIIAGPYEVIKDSKNGLPLHYWIYPKDVKNAMRTFHKTPEIIDFFNKEYGYKYPWSKYDQITIPGIGGGAECTSATLIGQGTIHDENAEQDFPSHWLVAHEAAHQWWGDLVTCRDWGHTWINESFGTYSDYLFTKHELGEEEGALNLLGKKNSYLNEAHNRYIRPIVFHRWEYPGQNFDSHTYPKGAVVLHMMRWILGDVPFQKTLSYFLEKHAYRSVDTHDFYTAVKDVTGQNLDWFFDQWLYKPGHPVFNVSYVWDKSDKKVSITIQQVQNRDNGVPIFRTPVIIGFTTWTDKFSEKVWLEEETETFEFDCEDQPLLVRFDEGNYLLKEWTFDKSSDELIYQLENDDAIGRTWAADQLLKYITKEDIVKSLTESAQSDPSWSVRKASVEILGQKMEESLIGLFMDQCEDENSKVRASAIRSLGKLNDSTLIGFFKVCYTKETSYVVKSEVIRSLGIFKDKSLNPFFEEAKQTDSPRNIVQRAAEWALSELDE